MIEHTSTQIDTDPLTDSGLNTTPGMWEMVSDALDGVPLPESINLAIHALCEGRARITAGQ